MIRVLLIFMLFPVILQAQEEDFSLTQKVQELLGFTVPTVSADELAEMRSITLLDAREPEEFAVSHLPKANYVGYKDFRMERLENVPKTDTIVVYCTIGYRSERIAEKLQQAGYQHVYNLFGGIFSWKNNGFPVVDPAGAETEKVHCYDKGWSLFLLKGEKVY